MTPEPTDNTPSGPEASLGADSPVVHHNRRKSDETLRVLSRSVEVFAEEAENLRKDVRMIEESSHRDRKVLRLLTALAALILVVLVVTGVTAVSNKENGEYIRDCTTPEGHCAKRLAAATAVIVEGTAYRTEAERLRTEIGVARSRGEQETVDARSARLADVELMVRYADQAVEAVRNDQPLPPPPSTTALPPFTPSTASDR